MDKFQAAFEILYFLSTADGEFDEREAQVIVNFLVSNNQSINFDYKKVIRAIDSLSDEGMLEEFTIAAQVFKNSCSVQDRRTLLEFAIELIGADGQFSDEEGDLLIYLANIWNIDLRRFLDS